MERIRHYFGNTGWRGAGLFLLISVIVAMVSFSLDDLPRGFALFGFFFFAVFLFRGRLTANPGRTEAGIRGFGAGLGIGAIVLKKLRLTNLALIPPVLIALVGIYLGCHFWFYSDPEIVVTS